MPSSQISKKAKKSVVIVADCEDKAAYCCGCIVRKDGRSIKVMAPSKFVKGRESRIKVIFCDKKELAATVIAVEDSFCLLRTTVHSECDTSVFEDVVQPERTFMVVPQSRTSFQIRSTYANVESLQSFKINEKIVVASSANYFVVSCDYLKKTPSGIPRLSGAPVFTMLGRIAGIVLQHYRDDDYDPGAAMKIVLKATNLREMLLLLDPPAPPAPPSKRKRGPISRAASRRRR